MDIAILALMLAIGLIVIAIIVLLKITVPQKQSERYINELAAQSDLLRNVKPVTHGDITMLPTFDATGAFTWTEKRITYIPTTQAYQSESQIPLDDESPLIDPDLDVARQIVIASIDKPLNDNQILPGNRFTSGKVWEQGVKSMTSRGWARTSGSGTYPAIGHDLAWLLLKIESELKLTGTIASLPRTLPREERIKLQGTGTENTPGNRGKA